MNLHATLLCTMLLTLNHAQAEPGKPQSQYTADCEMYIYNEGLTRFKPEVNTPFLISDLVTGGFSRHRVISKLGIEYEITLGVPQKWGSIDPCNLEQCPKVLVVKDPDTCQRSLGYNIGNGIIGAAKQGWSVQCTFKEE